ncbi:hypothetical protein LQ567_10910 [Niabella pedocola]|uniref:Uncharacterized protein n=1 Tax=Niabella pedocola TaxID=1752077 RepID=A0ABS8PQF1_9BACT|nr:hypothetical protein [Niabella pedocola]MCD2423271.1 hypothetical protein [Niabella pedocola]
MMAYDPVADISVIFLLPYRDLSSKDRFELCLKALARAGLAARIALGLTGQ